MREHECAQQSVRDGIRAVINMENRIVGLNGAPIANGLHESLSHQEETELIPIRAHDKSEIPMVQQLVERLVNEASRDNHTVLAPTHIMMRGDEILGYLSLGGIATVQCWFKSSVKNPRHSKDMIKHGETVFRERNVQTYVVACAEESPFTPHMERMGFRKLGTTVLWQKQL